MPHFPNYLLGADQPLPRKLQARGTILATVRAFWNDIANTLKTIRPKHNGYLANNRYHLARSKQISIHGYVYMSRNFRLLMRGI